MENRNNIFCAKRGIIINLTTNKRKEEAFCQSKHQNVHFTSSSYKYTKSTREKIPCLVSPLWQLKTSRRMKVLYPALRYKNNAFTKQEPKHSYKYSASTNLSWACISRCDSTSCPKGCTEQSKSMILVSKEHLSGVQQPQRNLGPHYNV